MRARFPPRMPQLHLQPDFATFQSLAQQGNLVPVMAELAADYETPLSAFQKIHDGRCGFLLESAELTQHSGRYSLLGSSPRIIFTARGREIEIEERGKKRSFTTTGDPLTELQALMKPFRPLEAQPLPVFHGGAVGYLAYDMVRFFEPTLPPPKRMNSACRTWCSWSRTPCSYSIIARGASPSSPTSTPTSMPTLEAAYEWAREADRRCDRQTGASRWPPSRCKPLPRQASDQLPEPVSNTTREEYEAMVLKMKEYISAGDIFQGVPSQRFETDYTAPRWTCSERCGM
jgi:anthranilate synthase component 1